MRLLFDQNISFRITKKLIDLDYTPIDAQGGCGCMYQLFGKEMEEIINELNEVLVA